MIIMIFDRFGKNEDEEIISDEEFISRKEFKKLKRLINAHQYHIENIQMFYNLEPTPLLRDMLDLSYEMLKFFDNVCRKYGIGYWLSDDTLLNAVRNGRLMAFSDEINVSVIQSDLMKLNDALASQIDDEGLDNLRYDHDALEITLLCPEIEGKLIGIVISAYDESQQIERNNLFPLSEIQLGSYTFNVPSNPNDYLRQINGKNYIRKISKVHDSSKLNRLKKQESILKEYISMFRKANENFE